MGRVGSESTGRGLPQVGSAQPGNGQSRNGRITGSSAGPYDSEDPLAERLGRAGGRVGFGSLRIPIPARAQLQVEKGSGELLRAVHVLVPSGRVSLSALAAPRSAPLWRSLSREIAESLSNDGARVRTEWGEWGREVHASSNGALSRFIGVDGPRWMLYGVATGPTDGASELTEVLREMMRGTVVYRGPDPLPVKTVLPLRVPEHLERNVERAREVAAHGPPASSPGRPPTAAAPPESIPARDPSRPSPPAAAPPGPEESPAVARLPSQGATIGPLGGVGRQVTGPPAPAAAALPPVPVPGYADTGGMPRASAVESTWSSANPVVSADQLAQQPAWALLGQAPSFWPHEHYQPSDGEVSRPEPWSSWEAGVRVPAVPDRGAWDDGRAFGDPLSGPPPSDPPLPEPTTGNHGESGPHDDPLGEDDGSTGEADLLNYTDSLHDVLTLDAAATRGWRARAERLGQRRPNEH